jgi:hypothetical protein
MCLADSTFSSFGVDVHEQVVIGSLQDLCVNEVDQCELELLFAIFLHSLTKKNLQYLMDLATEQYKISEEAAENLLTRPPDITKSVNETALHILEAYVRESSQQYYNVCSWLIKNKPLV